MVKQIIFNTGITQQCTQIRNVVIAAERQLGGSIEHDPIPDRDSTRLCNSEPQPDRTGFRKKTLPNQIWISKLL